MEVFAKTATTTELPTRNELALTDAVADEHL
jgi:hypothetical protein